PMNSPKFSQEPSQFSGSTEPRSSIAQTAKEAKAKIGSAATDAASKLKEGAEKLVSDKKETVADRVGAYGSAMHESAKSLEQQDPNIAWLTHRAAEKLEGVANYVRDRDFLGLRDDAADLARRHPAAFFGGMCMAGLVLGSVIRAARGASRESNDESGESNYMNENRESAASSYETSPSASSYETSPAQGTAIIPEI
ncbi:MAG TPA: hypothetical protein VL069_09085, partial [Opitutus sp.]|nr:hypothetical protein [Opitutus sp.]